MELTAAQQKYFAYWLTRSLPSDSLGKLTASLQDAQVDLTPHQIDAALFAFKSPLSKGAILADEAGLGKTIEAGIILSQFWAEHRRHLLIIVPANLRKQWTAELQEKFFLPSRILESKSFNHYIEDGNLNPFNCEEIVICSYQFAKTKAPYPKQTNWDSDRFLGSGTTAAVAHKMGRKWIGVELGEHAYTNCAVRMKKVIEGEQGGISKAVNWKGGGGFKFYELAPSLLNKDKYGNLVINKEYNADMLAAAMAKHQGFTYSPDTDMYWKQGYSSEHDFIFTTTQFITAEMLETIHDQLGEDELLLICYTKFQPECRNKFQNITIKKIPKVLLDTCEFDHDDYSLNIVSVPDIDDEEWKDLNNEEYNS